jgi:outer membrane protein assembly factor BamB
VCHVVALSLQDGKLLWDWQCESTQKVRSNYFQSRAAPTPVVDAQGVYAFFETGELVALSHDGTLLWQRCLVKDYGNFESTIGLAASLAQTADTLFVLVDHEGPSYLLAVTKKTGATAWRTSRDSRKSFASPMVIRIGQRDQIVISSDGTVDGYDPATGELLWSFDDVGGNTVGTPFPVGPGQFLVSATPGMHSERESEAKRSNFLMTVQPQDDGTFQPTVAWRASALPTFANPMTHQKVAYWINNVGVVTAYDVTTGKELYTKRLKQPCWAAPIGVGDRVYFFGKDGITTVVKAGPDFEILAENTLWDPDTTGRDAFASRRRSRGGHDASSENTGGRPAAPTQANNADPNDSATAPRFADPVQYGVAAVNGSLIIRTGALVYCVRDTR